MASLPNTTPFVPTPGLRVRLIDTTLFVTIVPYQLGDLGTVLQSCGMSGLWWVAFDRDRENPMRLPVSAFAEAGTPVLTPRESVAATGLLDDLEPVPLDDEPAAFDSALLRSALPLDAVHPAAPLRQAISTPSHVGDARLARPGAQQALRAFDALH